MRMQAERPGSERPGAVGRAKPAGGDSASGVERGGNRPGAGLQRLAGRAGRQGRASGQ